VCPRQSGTIQESQISTAHRLMCVKILLLAQLLVSGVRSLSFVLVWWINYSSTLEFFYSLFISIFVFTATNYVAPA
jgi:hypothetical protein